MTQTQLAVTMASIGINRDYTGFDLSSLDVDMQSWGSQHDVFRRAFDLAKLKIVSEVGTWKGASLFHMTEIADSMALPSEFICVDTWLGSNDILWLKPEWRE